MPIHGLFDYLDINRNDLTRIRETFLLLVNNTDDKFKLYSELYYRSLQGNGTNLDLRFLLLTICLECLFLPEADTELSFRLSIRAALLLSKYGYRDTKTIYDTVKQIYKIRSELVHRGKTNKLDRKLFWELTEIVRISLSLYLKDRNLFSEKSLTEIIF